MLSAVEGVGIFAIGETASFPGCVFPRVGHDMPLELAGACFFNGGSVKARWAKHWVDGGRTIQWQQRASLREMCVGKQHSKVKRIGGDRKTPTHTGVGAFPTGAHWSLVFWALLPWSLLCHEALACSDH